MRKVIYVLLDGVGDRPNSDLNWVTPLEAAYTPNLDLLSLKGRMGLVTPVGQDISPESDIAVFSMLGYDVTKSYVGRGVIEAIGSGVDFKNGYLALRGNFATVGEDLEIVDRRAGRNLAPEEAYALTESINAKVTLNAGASFRMIHTVGHRTVHVFKHPELSLSAEVSNTDPAYARIGGLGVAREHVEVMKVMQSKPLDDSAASKVGAALINEFTKKSFEVLKDHPVNQERKKKGKLPANVLLLRDAGNRLPDVPKLEEVFKRSFGCIADMPVEKGIAKVTGMREGATSKLGDYSAKAETALTLLHDHDVVYVHLKGPDEPGHDGDAELKKKIIEEIDLKFFGVLLDGLKSNNVVCAVTGDHSTPCSLKSHSADPVPLLVSGGSITPDSTVRFTERDGKNGSLGLMRGVEVLPKVLAYS